jgi:Flp pilus assembly protein TadB
LLVVFAVSVVLGVVVAPPLVPAGPLMWWTENMWRRRRVAHATRRAVVSGVADLVELFVTAIGAGLTVRLAVEAVAPRAPAVFVAAFEDVLDHVHRGESLADALERLVTHHGEAVRPLSRALVTSQRYGVPIGSSLAEVAAEARRERRRQAEICARRLPVLLLFPLVVCTLPAFALLTMLPTLAGALGSLNA